MTIQKVTAADDPTICKSHCLSKKQSIILEIKNSEYIKEKFLKFMEEF